MPEEVNAWQESYQKSIAAEQRRRALTPGGAAFVAAVLVISRVVTWVLPSPLDYRIMGSAGVVLVVGSVIRARRKGRSRGH